MTNKTNNEMTNKEMLIQHWEYQKKLVQTFGINSKVTGSILEYMSTIYSRACELYGYDWVKTNLTPIELDIEI